MFRCKGLLISKIIALSVPNDQMISEENIFEIVDRYTTLIITVVNITVVPKTQSKLLVKPCASDRSVIPVFTPV